jgi:hypothetical protein
MSNYFPDGRPIQKMMIALTSSPTCTGVSQTLDGNAIKALIDNFRADRYPGYTLESFTEMLTKVNLVHINGGRYNFGGIATIDAPTASAGGIFISGADNFRRLNITACALALYIKPTP